MFQFVAKKWAAHKQTIHVKNHFGTPSPKRHHNPEIILAVALFGGVLSPEYSQCYVNIVDLLNFVPLAFPEAKIHVYTSNKIPISLRETLTENGADVIFLDKEPTLSQRHEFSAYLPNESSMQNTCWFQPFELSKYRTETLLWLNLCKDFVKSGRSNKNQDDALLHMHGIINRHLDVTL